VEVGLLVDFTYSWNESWLSPERDWQKAVLAISLLMFTVALVAVILLFQYYGIDDMSRGVISITLVSSLLFSALSATKWSERGAILPSAACTVYCYWVLYRALSAYPPLRVEFSQGDNTAAIILGFVLAGVSVSYAGWSMARSTSKSSANEDLLSDDEDAEEGKVTDSKSYGAQDSVNNVPSSDDEQKDENNATANSRFHVVMATAACYAAMLLTDWGQSPDGKHGAGTTTMWIQIVSQWVCMLLYTWSLIAPQVLKNREF